MTCRRVERELVAYHFALLTGDDREAVEQHLAGCAACLRAFFDLKHALELGEDPAGPLPSKSSRARLRSAVAAELGLALAVTPPRAAPWWERPLAFGIAASLVLFAGKTTRVLTSGPGSPPYALSESRGVHP